MATNQTFISNLDGLMQNIKRYRTSKEYWEMMQACRRFRYLSPYNAMLVNIQKPGARYVLREDQWRDEYERVIKPNAQPLLVLVPFGPVDFVFEIGDTESTSLFKDSDDGINDIIEKLSKPFAIKSLVTPWTIQNLIECCSNHGIIFDMAMNAGTGYAAKIELLQKNVRTLEVILPRNEIIKYKAAYQISVNKNAGSGEQFTSILHELGHLFCQHLEAPPKWGKWTVRAISHEAREFEAESVAWLICERLNIHNPSEEYLVGYVDKNENIPFGVSIEMIMKAYNQVWDLCGKKPFYYKKGLLYLNDVDFKKKVDLVFKKTKEIKQKKNANKMFEQPTLF